VLILLLVVLSQLEKSHCFYVLAGELIVSEDFLIRDNSNSNPGPQCNSCKGICSLTLSMLLDLIQSVLLGTTNAGTHDLAQVQSHTGTDSNRTIQGHIQVPLTGTRIDDTVTPLQ
jgi:hypothetical protein